MGVSKFGKGGTNGDSLLAVEECGSDFGFRRGQHNVAHDFGDGMYGPLRVGLVLGACVGSREWLLRR